MNSYVEPPEVFVAEIFQQWSLQAVLYYARQQRQCDYSSFLHIGSPMLGHQIHGGCRLSASDLILALIDLRSTASDVDLLASFAYIGQISVSILLTLSKNTLSTFNEASITNECQIPTPSVTTAMFAIVSGSSASAAS